MRCQPKHGWKLHQHAPQSWDPMNFFRPKTKKSKGFAIFDPSKQGLQQGGGGGKTGVDQGQRRGHSAA